MAGAKAGIIERQWRPAKAGVSKKLTENQWILKIFKNSAETLRGADRPTNRFEIPFGDKHSGPLKDSADTFQMTLFIPRNATSCTGTHQLWL